MKLIYLVPLILLVACASPEKKMAKQTTPELLLRHKQCVEYLQTEKKGFEFKFGGPPWAKGVGADREERLKEKETIEFELLRRCQAGDKKACL